MNFIYKIFTLAFLISTVGTLNAQNINSQLPNSLFKKDNQGRFFMVAFPMNEYPEHPKVALEMYIASNESGKVKIKSNHNNYYKEFNIKAGEILTISSVDGNLDWDSEIREIGIRNNKVYTIESTVPVSVYAMNSKQFSTEGYQAIPVKNWGTEYRHCSYYDFNEAREWSSGFVIISSADSNKIEIDLKGVGEEIESGNGRKLGDKFNINLNSGEAYMYTGTGKTRGIFDLSGTSIKSISPISIISFHQRTMIPATVVTNGRDHLEESLLPVESWGTKYYSVELNRETDMGDFFRVMAGDDNTELNISWYDKYTGELIGDHNVVLEEAGDFFEANPQAVDNCFDGGNIPSIRGVSVFEANKPIQVIQYSYSSCWDKADGTYDPFMINLAPVEQYTEKIQFMTPSNIYTDDYNGHFLNLVIKGDSTDPQRNLQLISSVKLDGVPIIDIMPSILNNNAVDDIYWASIPVEQGPHTLESETEFNGYIYGFSFVDTYGWPIGNAGYNMLIEDTSAPVISKEEISMGKYKITASEKNNADANCEGCKPQIDSKIYREPVIISSNNFKAYLDTELESEDWYLHGDDELHYIFEVADISKDAEITFAVVDDYGNVSEETISHIAASVSNETYINGNKIELFPNPAKNMLRIKSNENYLVNNFRIISSDGQNVISKENYNLNGSLNISELSSGVYFINFNFKGEIYKLKFVKE